VNLIEGIIYDAQADATAGSVAGSSLWAQEAMENVLGVLADQLSIPRNTVTILNVPNTEYEPGIFAGTLKAGGKVANFGLWDAEAGQRIARLLTPVTV
jgi:hypothetical protein